MPWKRTGVVEQRCELVKEVRGEKASLAEVCRRLGVSRKTAYKWRLRYEQKRLKGLEDGSHRPRQVVKTSDHWLQRLRRMRHRRPSWGARKLHYQLAREHGPQDVPAVATISRWLKRWGLAKGRRWRKRGPVILRAALRPARYCNEVWTVDFKGWYRVGDGSRADPLTVRDLHSRYGLGMVLLRAVSVHTVRREFQKIFRKYGLPKRIRCDNGSPFGGGGPTGLTRLSAWWVKLGIEVEFLTPGRPCENGAHEQFHRVYKAEVARQPARTLAEQGRRGQRWLRYYNQQRPHEGLGMRTPASAYHRSRRRWSQKIRSWNYSGSWARCWVKGNGEISWRGIRRYVGEAFVGDYVGLKPESKGVWTVYFGPVVVGELHEKEHGRIRGIKYHRAKKRTPAGPHSGSLRSPP